MCAPCKALRCARLPESSSELRHSAPDRLELRRSHSPRRRTTLANARGAAEQPAEHLQLYEFEACPYCRLVREAFTELDLDALVYPTPHGGKRFRPKVEKLGGRQQFPYLVGPGQRSPSTLALSH